VLAPVQVVIVPFDGEGVSEAVKKIKAELLNENIDVRIDDSDKRPGEKFFFWEMKGVPFRIELGEKELKSGKASIFIRDVKEKVSVEISDLAESIKNLGAEYDERLLSRADDFFSDRIVDCKNKEELKKVLKSGKIARFNFCSVDKEGEDCAGFIEKDLMAEVRGSRADITEKAKGKCVICGKKASVVAYAGKSY